MRFAKLWSVRAFCATTSNLISVSGRGNCWQANRPIRSVRIATPPRVGTWRGGPADPARLAIGWASHCSTVYIKLKLDCQDLLSTVLELLSLDGGAVRDQGEPLDVTLLAIMQLQHTAIAYSGIECRRQNLIGTVGHGIQQAIVVILCNKITTKNHVALHTAHRPDVVHEAIDLLFVFANDCIDLFKVLAFFPNAE